MTPKWYQKHKNITSQYNIMPGVEHLSVMADTFACTGKLKAAEQFLLDNLGGENDESVIFWTELLGVCRLYVSMQAHMYTYTLSLHSTSLE